jgi:hypothetical protein
MFEGCQLQNERPVKSMQAILVIIDGTICDTRARHQLIGTPDFYRPDLMLADRPVPGSVECLKQLSRNYAIVYLGARHAFTRSVTEKWLRKMGYPKGSVYLAESQTDRLALIKAVQTKFDFIAGIGDRWDDNELHAEMGCLSIILQEFEGQWDTVIERIEKYLRKSKQAVNRTHLRGKVEGLARVCPLLLARFGEPLWTAYFESVLEMAENSREARRADDLASFAQHGLDPADLSAAAKWNELLREEDWEHNPVYGLQEFEFVEATRNRYVHKVTRCLYAELWKEQGLPEIGYQIHCHTDQAWWDRPAWNPEVRFEQPQTLMQGDDCCLFIQSLPAEEKHIQETS